jgi:hypothetical protein
MARRQDLPRRDGAVQALRGQNIGNPACGNEFAATELWMPAMRRTATARTSVVVGDEPLSTAADPDEFEVVQNP